jgi:hypothetical protein
MLTGPLFTNIFFSSLTNYTNNAIVILEQIISYSDFFATASSCHYKLSRIDLPNLLCILRSFVIVVVVLVLKGVDTIRITSSV